MNKKIRIIVVLGVLCVALASYAIVTSILNDAEDTETNIVLSSVSSEDLTGFSFQHHKDAEYTEDVYSFVKKAGTWYYDDDKDFPVNQAFAQTKAEVIREIKAERIVEENPEDISQYGLDEPYLTVSVSDTENTYVYYVGDYNESTTTYYIMQEGHDAVYLADAQLFIAFDLQLWDFISKEEFPELDVDSFTAISFEFPSEKISLKKAKLEKDYVKSEWYLLDDNGQIIENTDKVETDQYPKIIPTFEYLRAVDYKYEDNEAGLYGFDKPELIIKIEYEINGEKDNFELIIGSVTAENHIYEDYYAKSNKSDAVLTIKFDLLEELSMMNKDAMIIK